MKKFDEIYKEIYNKNFNELEYLRKAKIKKFAISIVIAIIVILLAAQSVAVFIPYIFIIVMMVLVFSMAFGNGKYKNKFKKTVIATFIKNLDENLNYYPEKKMDPALYREGEFESYDNYYSEDTIEGLLDGKYRVRMSEIRTEEENMDSDGNTNTHTVFHGIFGYIECPKNIKTTIKIRSDKGILGNLFSEKTKLEMDSSEFEKYFDINTEDKIIAMQILTSDVMAMMIDFAKETKIKYELTIKVNHIYIRFHTGEVFEPRMFKKSLDYDTLKKYYDIIDFVFKVSREMNKVIENTDI